MSYSLLDNWDVKSILASKLTGSWKYDTAPTLTFAYGDYSSLIDKDTDSGNFQIKYKRTSGVGNYGTYSYTGETLTHFNYGNQTWIAKHSSQPALPLLTYTTSQAAGTNAQVNVDDAYKSVSAISVNVDDAWKSVTSGLVQVDDAWKTIF